MVAAVDLQPLEPVLAAHFRVERFPHSLDVSADDSDLRVQFQTDARYASFIDRSSLRDVLGLRLPVAAVEDVLLGKIWAVEDVQRRPSKRQKDLADIARILEAFPELRASVPHAILQRLV